jgi:RNA polymerase sigma-70 factor (ECF subfamily)
MATRSEVSMASVDVALTNSEALAAPAGERGLVEECRRGDPQAFARLVAVHERLVFNLAARMLGDLEEAKDLSQEVFLQVYRQLPRFEGRSSLKTWIYRIVVNQCRNRHRWWKRRRRDQALPIEELTASDNAQLAMKPTDGPEEQLSRREQSARVQRALQKLSIDHRAVLVLREVEDLSGTEIAETLGVAEGTVKSRLARARDALRNALLAPEGNGA